MISRLLNSIIATGFLTTAAYAGSPGYGFTTEKDCLPIQIEPTKTYTASASLQVATRLRFLEPIELYLVSAPALWDVQSSGNHLWFRPLSEAAPGSHTGITVVLESGEEFDFMAVEDDNPPTQCYYVLDDASRLTGVQAGLDDGSEIGRLKAEYRKATEVAKNAVALSNVAPVPSINTSSYANKLKTERIASQIEEQASDAIRHFQMSIHTGYEWTEPEGDRIYVDSVYDDGRFTYVRVDSTGFGTPAVYAVNDDDAYMVDYDYDDLTGVYRINGLYDALRVRLDTRKIDIVRRR